MENSSRLFSILYPDLQYMGAIKNWVSGSYQTLDPKFWLPGSHQKSGSGVLGTWEPPKKSGSGILGTWKPPTKCTVIFKLLYRIPILIFKEPIFL